MTGRGWVDNCDRYLSGIPVSDVLTGFYFSNIKALFDTVEVMLEPVGHKDRFAVCGFDNILQCIQLSVMELDGIAGIGINGTVGKLGQLSGERSSIGSSDLNLFEL